MNLPKKILTYLSVHRKENKHRLVSTLKVESKELMEALAALEQEGKIKMELGKAILVGEKEGTPAKMEQETEPLEAITENEEPFQEEPPERKEGTLIFLNPKGSGFITDDEGNEYYVPKKALSPSAAFGRGERVSFKVIPDDKCPQAAEVESLSPS